MYHVVIEKASKGKVKEKDGYYYVDFDRVLAHHEVGQGYAIGKPIPEMVKRVKKLIELGGKVKIFTARVSGGAHRVKEVEDWLKDNGLPELEVTNIKGQDAIAFWDDKAKEVLPNKGKFRNSKLYD